MNHGLEPHVDFSGANDFGDIRRIIGLKESDLDAFVGEVSQLLGQVDGGMVWRCVPGKRQLDKPGQRRSNRGQYQFMRNVILSVDILLSISYFAFCIHEARKGLGDLRGWEGEACPFARII